VAGVVGVNTPHTSRPPADPIELLRQRFGEQMYIVQFQDPARGADKIFNSRVEQTFDAFMRKPVPRSDTEPSEAPVAGLGASPRLNLEFPQMIAGYDAKHDPRTPILSPEEKKVFVDTFTKTGFTGGINWYRNMSRNWQRSADLDYTVRVPALMIMAENDQVLPPSAADGMEKIIPDLEKYLVKGSGHWTQQEKPEEVSAKLIEWRRRRFG
jgi:pimeloyl-ACP methyl ester carboxylesterase